MAYKREGLVCFSPDRTQLGFWCQGCRHLHVVTIAPGASPWGFNGNVESPTLTPSIRSFWPKRAAHDGEPERPEQTRCHSFLIDGVIDFLPDSAAHELRGKHPLQQIPDSYGGVE